MRLSDLPNIISVLRILLVAPVVYLLLDKQFSLALLLFSVAGVSDGLDGYLAKRNHWQSRLGSILDPLADKLLLVSSYIALAWLGLIPIWLVSGVLVRDLIIIIGAVAYHFMLGSYDMAPSFISKANTFMQIFLVLAVVFSYGIVALPGEFLLLLTYAVGVTTLVSGIHYMWVWGRRAERQHQDHSHDDARL